MAIGVEATVVVKAPAKRPGGATLSADLTSTVLRSRGVIHVSALRSGKPFEEVLGASFDGAFPDDYGAPALSPQLAAGTLIALVIARKFWEPIIGV